jgi:hypothetical protein
MRGRDHEVLRDDRFAALGDDRKENKKGSRSRP